MKCAHETEHKGNFSNPYAVCTSKKEESCQKFWPFEMVYVKKPAQEANVGSGFPQITRGLKNE